MGIKKGDEAATYASARRAVPSALRSLTAVFGMGTGGASSLLPPHRKFVAMAGPRPKGGPRTAISDRRNASNKESRGLAAGPPAVQATEDKPNASLVRLG